MNHSLFPDYFPFEERRDEQEARRIAEALHEVELSSLGNNTERRAVCRRLQEHGINTAWEVLALQREEVKHWAGVGGAFMSILDEMREEIHRFPERIVRTWQQEFATLIFPDDLATESSLIPTVSEPATEHDESDPEKRLMNAILETEQVFCQIIRLLQYRSPLGSIVLRRYFLEGLAVDTIVKLEQLSSRTAVYRIVNRQFLQPLLAGEMLHGIQLSSEFRTQMQHLSVDLTFRPATILEGLSVIRPERFLSLLHLSLLRRTTMETMWATDFIVPTQEVQRSRRMLHRLLLHLQQQPTFQSPHTLQIALSALPERLFPLLEHHPWIETDHKGNHQLIALHLNTDAGRVARILQRANSPLTKHQILLQYERTYMERPQHLSLRKLHAHHPQIVAVKRGVWTWKEEA